MGTAAGGEHNGSCLLGEGGVEIKEERGHDVDGPGGRRGPTICLQMLGGSLRSTRVEVTSTKAKQNIK